MYRNIHAGLFMLMGLVIGSLAALNPSLPAWYKPQPKCSEGNACCAWNTNYHCIIDREEVLANCSTQTPETDMADLIVECSASWGRRCARIDLMEMKTVLPKLKRLQLVNCLPSANSVLSNKGVKDNEIQLQMVGSGFLSGLIDMELSLLINGTDFTGYPSDCNLRHLDISSSRLPQIPSNFLLHCKGLETVNLSGNFITWLGHIDMIILLQFTHLETLDLQRNYMTDFGANAVPAIMSGLTSAIKKGIHYQLKGHPWLERTIMDFLCRDLGMCSEYSSLPSLCRLIQMDWSIKVPLIGYHLKMLFRYSGVRLRVLRLNHNRLRSIPGAIFGMGELRELYVADNDIGEDALGIQGACIFRMLNHLTHLDLAGNRITRLRHDTFAYLKRLIHLSLARNRLLVVPPDALTPLANGLVSLNFSGNALYEFRLEPGTRMADLETLDLSHNRQTALWPNLSAALPALRFLHLRSNHLSEVPAGFLVPPRDLIHVSLGGNPLLLRRMPAASFRTSGRKTLAERVRLSLAEFGGPAPSPWSLVCDCSSVFRAVSEEEANWRFLHRFHYPALFPAVHCGAAGLLCAVPDLACPTRCGCCDAGAACGCVFRCPVSCRCARDRSWTQVTVSCSGPALSQLPDHFGGARSLVTSLNVTAATIDVLDSGADQALCRHGLAALLHLSVTLSGVHRLPPGAFRCLPSLRSLSLRANNVSALPAGLWANASRRLAAVDLRANRLQRLAAADFAGLPSLARIDLRANPLRCDCTWERRFFAWTAARAAEGVLVVLPRSCTVSGPLRRFGTSGASAVAFRRSAVDAACRRWRAETDAVRRGLFFGLPGLAMALAVLALAFVLHRRRYALLVRLDERLVLWPRVRRLLRFAPGHRGRIDVGLVFHEVQSDKEKAVQRFVAGLGRGLTVQRFASFMPGALHVCQVREFAAEVGVCVILVSSELLDDLNYIEPLHRLLRDHLSPNHRLVLVYAEADSALNSHEAYTDLRHLLHAYTSLVWGSREFWDRLRLAMPPRRASQSPQAAAAAAEVELEQIPRLANLCVMSHETQLPLVREIYERYRAVLSLVHYRHGRVYGADLSGLAGEAPAEEEEELSLVEVLCTTEQVLLVLSPALLDRQSYAAQLTANLTRRLERLRFPHSVIVVRVALPNSEAGPLAELLDTHRGSVTVLEVGAGEVDWERQLDPLLLSLPKGPDAVLGAALTEAEYMGLLVETPLPVMAEVPEDAEFRLNRLTWRRGAQEGDAILDEVAGDDVPLLA